MARLLFLGFVYPPELEDYVLRHERGLSQIAANKLGWLFIRGIENAFREGMDLLSVLAVSRFPIFSKLFIAPRTKVRENGSELRFVPYINIPFIKRFIIMLSAALSLAHWLRQTRHLPDRIVTTYGMITPTLVAAAFTCRWYRVPCVLLVPDLPEFFRPGHLASPLVRWLRNINLHLVYRFADRMQGFVFLTKHMADRFRIRGRPFTVVEGCVGEVTDKDISDQMPVLQPRQRIVMYAGILAAAYGVRMLVQGFMRLKDPDYRLWICGRGELETEIQEHALKDPRIIYLGMLPNSEVVDRERQATLLVNPRPSDSEFTRYSFPSKNLEYLSTGTPVMLCRLPGIPIEYFDYVYTLEEESVEGMAKLLEKVLQKTDAELDAFGKRAQRFVLEHKNFQKQGEKIRRVMDLVTQQGTIGD